MKFDPFYILRKPIMTEKTHRLSEDMKRYVFEVDRRATKPQIRRAIQLLFPGVKVRKVNTMNVKSRKKRSFGAGVRTMGQTRAYKKAVITLSDDSRELDLI